MWRVISLQATGSTNDEARRAAAQDASHGTVIIAGEQRGGRGRDGRSWASPPGNLYLSALLRLSLPPSRMTELSFVAALAVADAVDDLLPDCPRAHLKWPNDVLLEGAKVAGILIEMEGNAAILGIGLNVLHRPEGTPYPATCLAEHATLIPPRETLTPPSPKGRGSMVGEVATSNVPSPPGRGKGEGRGEGEGANLLDAARTSLLASLATGLDHWQRDGFAAIRADWLARAHPPGTPLRVRTPQLQGSFAGLDADGALLLDTAEGRKRIIAGDVTPA